MARWFSSDTRTPLRPRDANRRALDAFFAAETRRAAPRETLAQAYERGYQDGYAAGHAAGKLWGWLWFGGK